MSTAVDRENDKVTLGDKAEDGDEENDSTHRVGEEDYDKENDEVTTHLWSGEWLSEGTEWVDEGTHCW